MRLYADEQFPHSVSELLRTLGHDVLTVQEAGKYISGKTEDSVSDTLQTLTSFGQVA
jgi:Domain of unknown function (DUF5615)